MILKYRYFSIPGIEMKVWYRYFSIPGIEIELGYRYFSIPGIEIYSKYRYLFRYQSIHTSIDTKYRYLRYLTPLTQDVPGPGDLLYSFDTVFSLLLLFGSGYKPVPAVTGQATTSGTTGKTLTNLNHKP